MPEARANASSIDVSQSSSESAYCSHRPMVSIAQLNPAQRDLGDALQEAVDIFGRENKDADELIAKTRQEIHELKNRQTLTENVLKNLLCTCHGKPVVMCLGIEGV